ncbi:MAG TPA: TonB-dependent receptor [Pyrinomonadaceae bacterium]|jgi:hypothetical protein
MRSRFVKSISLAAALSAFLLAASAPLALRAQESRGRITGTVTDPNKAAVPGATVTVSDPARGTNNSLTTNDEGFFQAPYLLPGTYQVIVEVSGFKKYIQDGVVLQINETRDLDITLELGGTQETVTVMAGTAELNSADANLGQTVDNKRIAELPLVHGDPYTLVGLSPGVAYTGSTRLDRPFEPTHIVGYAVNGTRGNRSDLLIDGAPSTATANANEVIASYVPPSDIVQEFKVQTSTYDSQFGNTEGGVTSITIKSGTNELHGTAYIWTEPGGMAANDFFGKSRPIPQPRPFTYSNRPGFSINGPVRIPWLYNGKDKTFFLFGYEGIRDSRPRFDAGQSVFVPTQALRNGDFSAFACPPGVTTNCVTIYNPYTRRPSGTAGQFVADPFPGNVIPQNLLNPTAQTVLKFFAQPKQPGLTGNIFDSQLTETTKPYDNFTFRIDQNIGASNRLFVRGSAYNRDSHYNDYFGTAATGVNFKFISRQGVIDDVWTLNPTTVLNVRYGYNHFIRFQDQDLDARGFDLTQLGFPAAFNSLIPDDIRRFPRFDFPANTVLGTAFGNENRPVDSHAVSAVVNKALDRHSLKFGAEQRIYRENDVFSSNDQTGQFVFDNLYTRQNSASGADFNGLQAFASFLLGLPRTQQIVRRSDYSEFSKTWGLFVHDDFRVSNNLTLNLGLRYEVETPLVERQNKSVSGFDFNYTQPFQAAAQAKFAALTDADLKARLTQLNTPGGLLFAGKDTGSGLYDTPKNTFLPRAGFAYRWNDRTVVRGGFGLFAGFLGERRGDVIQPGYTRTTTVGTTTNANGAPIPASMTSALTGVTILEPVGNAAGRQTGLGTNISFFNQNPKVSKQARWSIGVQRELWGGFVADVEYVGNHGYDIEIVRNINALPNKYLNTDNSRTAAQVANNSVLAGTVANPFAGLAEFAGTTFADPTITRAQLLRPYPQFGDILTTNNDGKTWYHSGQFAVEKRFSKGYTVQAAYTWSKWLQATEYLNAADPEPVKLISDQDVPHRFAFSAMYEFPFGKGREFFSNANWLTNAVLGGWQLGGTLQLQSGFPVAFGAYNATTAVTSGDLFYNGGEVAIPSGERGTARWFNTAAFTSALTTTGTLATPTNHLRTFPYRLSTVRRDYIKNLDLTLKKDVLIRESMKVQLRFEALNALNEPYFPAPVVNAASGDFGKISASNQDNYARRVQLGAKFIF